MNEARSVWWRGMFTGIFIGLVPGGLLYAIVVGLTCR